MTTQERVDPGRIAAVGCCFGAVSSWSWRARGRMSKRSSGFHPGLSSPRPHDSRNIAGQVLMCIGADDPIVPLEARAGFEQEMRDHGVDWQMNVYRGAKHRFTDPYAAAAGAPALEYNERVAARSWRAMLDLFAEALS